MKISQVKNLDLKHKRVFLRADLNIPLKNKKILQNYRLESIIPTIKYIQENGGKVILATHLGRPKAANTINFFDENLTTEILLPWFKAKGFKIKLERDLQKTQILSMQDFTEILLLENLRFFNGEQGTTKERQSFVQMLKPLADVYINDAFALFHRDDCSVTMLAQQFEKKAFGLLVEKEIKKLSKLKENPAQPFVLVLGGIKVKSKINLLQNFIEKSETNRPQSILIAGAIANTFLKAQGFNVGKSLVEDESIDFAKDFLNKAKEKGVNILLPQDLLVAQNEAEFNYYQKGKIPNDGICVDIGPETIESFQNIIKNAKTIFTNGTAGIYTKPESNKGSQKILELIANSNAYTVAGGGDCVAAVYMFNLQEKFDFLSTGGGATLAFLSSKDPQKDLPALKVF